MDFLKSISPRTLPGVQELQRRDLLHRASDLAFEEQNITEDEEDFFEDEGTKIRGSNVLVLGVSKDGLISESFSLWLKSPKMGALSTIHLKRRSVISDSAPICGDLAFKEQNITEDKEDFLEDEGTKIRGCYLLFLGVSRQFCLKT